MFYRLDEEKYKQTARKMAAEGCVLLKNDRKALPLKDETIAVFGRSAFRYYKSGLGSGGLVNTKYVVGILDALEEDTHLHVHAGLKTIYEEWLKEHPYDEGSGWGNVPWSQIEMPVTDEMLQISKDADAAVVVIGRTAGEDQDNCPDAGSYLLSDIEIEMIKKVSNAFERTIVLLNTGNIVDMKWVASADPAAVMYVWQGGQEGGHGVLDVLTGIVTPCGKLTDTIARDIKCYPSTSCFGGETFNYYKEDIFVGYRYFETFDQKDVLYPFGFGLSYTSFEIEAAIASVNEKEILIEVEITNNGSCCGKEVVQVYAEAPQGKLGKSKRVLTAFEKTKELAPRESQKMTLTLSKAAFASYDDSGCTGHKDCFVLEEGNYTFYVGSDVRTAESAGSLFQSFQIIEQLHEVCAPVRSFNRIKAVVDEQGVVCLSEEAVPLRTQNPYERMSECMPKCLDHIGDQGIKLGDVYEGKASLDTFVAQLTDVELMSMFHGEGMCSPKVTPGTAAAFGGVIPSLRDKGVPVACCADGPSGIRMDCGTKAFSLPNGMVIGSSFNLELTKELYTYLGLELRKNRIDTLLGPGMNIHRNPLNGRNFEYFSEDPYLTGKMAAAQLQGMNQSASTGTIKHFATNNQESFRTKTDAVVSQRALREIYLKGFEIAVKEGACRSVMTTYSPLNGIWTAGSYDLNTIVLRDEWHFDGIVMTDWWAVANIEGEPGSERNHSVMAAAQNDLFMVTTQADDFSIDNIKEKFDSGELTRAQLQRNAKNILGFILKSPAMLYELGKISEEELSGRKAQDDDAFLPEDMLTFYPQQDTNEICIEGHHFNTDAGNTEFFCIEISENGDYEIVFDIRADFPEMAQLPVSISVDNIYRGTFTMRGTNGRLIRETESLGIILGRYHYIKFYFGVSGMQIEQITIRPVKDTRTV